jgi:hypothetical protein
MATEFLAWATTKTKLSLAKMSKSKPGMKHGT